MAVLDVRVSAEGAESLCRDRHNATLADVNSDVKRMNLSLLLVSAVGWWEGMFVSESITHIFK